jgi:hypothetical protein
MRIKAMVLIAATFAVLSIAACSSEPTATSSSDNKNTKPAESGPRKALKKFYEVIGTDRPSYGAEAGEDTELQAVIHARLVSVPAGRHARIKNERERGSHRGKALGARFGIRHA